MAEQRLSSLWITASPMRAASLFVSAGVERESAAPENSNVGTVTRSMR